MSVVYAFLLRSLRITSCSSMSFSEVGNLIFSRPYPQQRLGKFIGPNALPLLTLLKNCPLIKDWLLGTNQSDECCLYTFATESRYHLMLLCELFPASQVVVYKFWRQHNNILHNSLRLAAQIIFKMVEWSYETSSLRDEQSLCLFGFVIYFQIFFYSTVVLFLSLFLPMLLLCNYLSFVKPQTSF
ncbi:hypothetical protein ARALYDRAFT_917933 [Arabidopsis lyrata subsp. lyrata]|uniref:Uncharacterized protein n=1 Tax=Arabidopsis lyrata subsp. lyrata TaxID=81972 RepID=D7MNT4_ARALL|nr:hypothetical protein ARALYDRAFT_917933 [Arabidopsis lyrata subsp. lyrata]